MQVILFVVGIMSLSGLLVFGSAKYHYYKVNKLADKYNKPSEMKDLTHFTYIREDLKQEAKKIDNTKTTLNEQSLNFEFKVDNITSPNIENLNELVQENKNLSKKGQTIFKSAISKQDNQKQNEINTDIDMEIEL